MAKKAEAVKLDYYPETVKDWMEVKKKLAELMVTVKPLIQKERDLRNTVQQEIFPSPREGTNNAVLPNGGRLTFTYKLKRDIDEGVINLTLAELRDLGVRTDELVEWKPKLVTSLYRTLTDEQRHVMDHGLTTKPETPTLNFTPPSKRKE